jgi:hypothetical protein
LRYNRSRFFTFLFFMQTLSGKLWTSFSKFVGFFTSNPTKLGSHFSGFSTIFCGFYKNQQLTQHYSRITLQPGPWKFFKSYRYAPGFCLRPKEGCRPYNVAPGHGRRRGWPKSSGSDDGVGWGRVWGGVQANLRLICGRSCAVTAPASLDGEAPWWRPQERRLQRVSGQCAWACGSDNFGRCVRWW